MWYQRARRVLFWRRYLLAGLILLAILFGVFGNRLLQPFVPVCDAPPTYHEDVPQALRDQIDELQATYDGIVGQRDAMFRGEMLRGALLNTYAWDTVGEIAGYAAVVAFAGAAVLTVLVGLGLVHLRRAGRQTT